MMLMVMVCSLEGGGTPRRDIDRELVGQEKWDLHHFILSLGISHHIVQLRKPL